MVTLEQLCGLADRGALANEAGAERDLVRRELRLAPEFDPSRHGRGTPGAGALMDKLAFELRDTGEHS